MKRNTPDHPKMYDLSAALDIERNHAGGVMAFIWLFAQKYAPRGDVGRYSNVAIARGIDWRGDPDRLIEALLKCRWLDACPCHRLRIHDWPDHIEQGVARLDVVVKNGLLECYKTSQQTASDSLDKTSEKLATASEKLPAVAVAIAGAFLTDSPPIPPADAGGEKVVVAELVKTPDPESPPPKPPGPRVPKPKAAMVVRTPPSPRAHRRSLNGASPPLEVPQAERQTSEIRARSGTPSPPSVSPEDTLTRERKAAELHVRNLAEQARTYAVSVGQHPGRRELRVFREWARAGHPLVEIQAAIDRLDHIRTRQLRL